MTPTTKTFSDVIRNMNEETTQIAREWYAEKRKVGIVQTLIRMIQRFGDIYFVKGGICRGSSGFRDAANSALFELFCFAKYWELNEQEKGRM